MDTRDDGTTDASASRPRLPRLGPATGKQRRAKADRERPFMKNPTPLVRDLLFHVRPQVSAERAGWLSSLATHDPERFLVEVLSSSETGDVDLPDALRRAVEERLSQIRAGVSGRYLTHGRASAPLLTLDEDPVVESQRRIDAVAERVRARLPGRSEHRPPSTA
jgi:hypothetical protein